MAQVLVAEAAQPYPVPENWCWTRIKYVAEVVTGRTPSGRKPVYFGGVAPFFQQVDLALGRHVNDAQEYLSERGKAVSRMIPAGSTAVCCAGGEVRCGYLEVAGATERQINTVIPKIDPLYLYYYCCSERFVSQLGPKASSAAKRKIEDCMIPLPPMMEQRRIVACVEVFFTKMNQVKEELEDLIDSYEVRRAYVLQRALAGEMTDFDGKGRGWSLGLNGVSSAPTQEDKRIAAVVEERFVEGLQAKILAETSILKIDFTKKIILDQAFRGKLGTNDPSEEGGDKLLEKILVSTASTE